MAETLKNPLPYKNPELPLERRINDLLGRMTAAEKVRQLDQYQGDIFVDKTHPMMHTVMADDANVVREKLVSTIGREGIGCIHDLYGFAGAINEIQRYAVEETRLGIPILFSEEALHGLGRPGCTIFPHAISQASSFHPEIAGKIGHAIAAETRSFGIHETFGPVLDLAREPRWGRTEETYGEDTYLSSRMGVAMIRGLQGESLAADDSIIAEPKHFAVHGIPESGLNTSACSIGEREMQTYHLPVFEAAFTEGGAVNAMCSYNSIDGVPCSADSRLLTDLLRKDWGMPGFVRSDLGAIRRLAQDHFTAATEKDAIRQALTAGTDMQYYDFSHEGYQNAILDMTETGEIPEETLNTAVARVLRVKFLLGLFEKPYAAPGRSKEVVRCPKHIALALEAARESICLLKNENGLLPLQKNIQKIAVLGPSADTARLGDYTPYVEGFEPVTLLQGIRNIVSPDTLVTYVKGTGVLSDELTAIPPENLTSAAGIVGLYAEYYNNAALEGEPAFTRSDSCINFNWILAVPDNRITAPRFSVRWTGCLHSEVKLDGYLGIASQDSMRLWIDGTLLVDTWGRHDAPKAVPFTLEAGRNYQLKVEYVKDANGKEVLLGWNHTGEDIKKAVEAAIGADVAVIAVGDSEKTCGEGVDRSCLDLPGNQYELVKAVCATGTPVVLVLQNGRPVTLSREIGQIAALVEAWYPGEQGGTALAEVLFGDYNPAGRLPVSFPKTLGQIPVYYNKRRGGAKNYMDQDSTPLFAFGYGLSYTTFAYEKLEVTPVQKDGEIRVGIRFQVKNTGTRAGDEVVQLYLCDKVCSIVRPEKELRRFRRLHLKPGETVPVDFELETKDLAFLDRNYNKVVEPGTFRIMAGPSSDHIALSAEFDIM